VSTKACEVQLTKRKNAGLSLTPADYYELFEVLKVRLLASAAITFCQDSLHFNSIATVGWQEDILNLLKTKTNSFLA
jgi:hypothetical protein